MTTQARGRELESSYPACVGWLDRELRGWSRRELEDSLKLVRDFMMPNWDVHPEMVTHTWVISTKSVAALQPGQWAALEDRTIVCFDLPKGRSVLRV